MNEKTKKALSDLMKTIINAVIAFVTALTVASCGTTRAVIKTNADNTASTITITTNNPTSVAVDPQTHLSILPKQNED